MRSRFFPVFILLLVDAPVSAEPQSSYPVISQAAQKVRDDDRRLILEAELLAERKMLAEAQSTFDASSNEENRAGLHRHRENVTALLRELDDTSGKRALQTPRVTLAARRPLGRGSTPAPGPTANFWNPYNRAVEPVDSSTP